MEYPKELISKCWFECTEDKDKYPAIYNHSLVCFSCSNRLALEEFYFHEIRADELFFDACFCQSCFEHFISFKKTYFHTHSSKHHLCKSCFSEFFIIIDTEKVESDVKLTCVKRLPLPKHTKSANKI